MKFSKNNMSQIHLTSEQLPHVHRLLDILQRSHVAFDMSMMGAGKTYTTTELSKMAGFKYVVVICPATVESKWRDMAKYGINLFKVISYQSLRSRKGCKPSHDLLNREDKITEGGQEEIIFTPTETLKKITTEGCLFVFDEAQNIKNKNDQWYACKAISSFIFKVGGNSRFVLLSGTPIDKEEHAINLMTMMGFIKSSKLYTFNKEEKNLKLYGAQELIDYCKMIDQAKAAIESEKNAAMADLKSQVATLSLSIAEKILKDELSNKESQTKLVDQLLGDVKLN
jgi:hypothetical protein